MSRRVRRRVSSSQDHPTAIIASPARPETVAESPRTPGAVDWTNLPNDTVVLLISYLGYRDRASLAATCRVFRALAASPCLFTDLDLRAYTCNPDTAASLAARCTELRRLRIRGHDAAASAIYLCARRAIEISAESCRGISDCTLSALAARHELLQTLEIGPEPCEKISSDAVRQVAMCCPRLRRLRLSGVPQIQGEAIEALAHFCPQLEEIAFLDCGSIDQCAFSCVSSLRYLSVAGSQDLKWNLATVAWSKLNLVGIDVSRTDVSANCVLKLLSSPNSLKVLCALNCPTVDTERNHDPVAFSGSRGKLLLATFTDISLGIASLFDDPTFNKNDKNLNHARSWVEWILSQSLLRMAETNPHGMDTFWVQQGAALFLNLIKSSQVDVQERAATGLATFVVVDDENAAADPSRAEVVMRNGGIPLLLDLTRSYQECLQSEAAKAIANLSVNSKVAKAVADGGGITILTDLARSTNRLVAEEAAGGLWNLSVGEEHKVAIGEAGGVKALVDLIFKWPSGIDVLERAAGALANLAADDKCGIEVAAAGGVRALVMLAQSCKVDAVQEQAARALANMAAHGDSNDNNAVVGQEAGALEALVQLTCSNNDGVRQEAAGALWNLSFDDKNREAIAAAGGVEALVALAGACSNASHGLQERAAGALWGLSVSEANSIAIGSEGGIAPLITLARSDAEDVHETAAGALWNLAFHSVNALRIVEEGGVPALVHLCSSSGSKMARFMAALALSYMFDGRMDEIGAGGSSSEGAGASKSVNFDGAKRVALKQIDTFLLTFSDPHIFAFAAVSSAPAALLQVADVARIQEAGHLRCSGSEIGRFVTMLRNPSSILRACAAFALLQFTVPGGRHAIHHVSLLQKAGAARILRAAAASTTAPVEAKVFARVVLRNLEHHRLEA